MNLHEYQSWCGDHLSFTRVQASRFAKQVAGDFNPLHDIEARRFCVPGDLLFVSLLARYGLARSTSVEFEGMVDEKVVFDLPEQIPEKFNLQGTNGTDYLALMRHESMSFVQPFVLELAQRYVEFSGKTFPDILVALMQKHQVMINPTRPLVIYKNMSVDLIGNAESVVAAINDAAQGEADYKMNLQLTNTELKLQGKKAEAVLNYTITVNGDAFGTGQKLMILGGLRDYDQQVIDDIVGQYQTWKQDYVPV